jgi:hypothetical protein
MYPLPDAGTILNRIRRDACRQRVKNVKSIFTLFLPCSCFFVRQRNKRVRLFPKFLSLCSQKNSQSLRPKHREFAPQTPRVSAQNSLRLRPKLPTFFYKGYGGIGFGVWGCTASAHIRKRGAYRLVRSALTAFRKISQFGNRRFIIFIICKLIKYATFQSNEQSLLRFC